MVTIGNQTYYTENIPAEGTVNISTAICQPQRAKLKPNHLEMVRQQHKQFMESKRGSHKR